MATRIYLPARFEGATMAKLAGDITAAGGGRLPPGVTFDFTRLTFIKPPGVCFLSNLTLWLDAQGTKVEFEFGPLTEPLRYLDDSRFIFQHTGTKLRASSSPRSTTIPLRRVTHAESHMWLRLTVVPWLSGCLSVPESALGEVQTSISELFNNIQDHTQLDIGSIFVQHYPRQKRVSIAVADFGRGIPGSVRDVLPGLSDAEAIVKAARDGFTSKSRPTNRGAGLAYLLDTIVGQNRGKVTIYSLAGIVRFYNYQGRVLYREDRSTGFCPGTLFEIELPTMDLRSDDDGAGELEW